MKKIESILYLRTDPTSQKVVAGGSVAHTLGVIKGFLKEGKRVVCAASFMGDQMQELNPQEVKHLVIPRMYHSLPWRIMCMVLNLSYTRQILPLFKKYTFDCIYQRCSLFNCIGVILSKIKGVPFILEYNGSEVWVDKHWGGAKGKCWKLLWLASWIERINLRHASSIVVVSQALKDELVSRGVKSDKILVNPNGVNVEEFDPELLRHDREAMRKALHLEDKFVFGFVGSFSIWHGIGVIAAMIPEVIKQNPEAHFLLIGEGPLLTFLKEELTKAGIGPDYVTCTGMVQQKEAKKYLAACDAYLSPTQPNSDGTRFFGSPTKLFEYMSMAKPIIASDLEQLSDILRPTDDYSAVGILIKPKDTQGFIGAANLLVKADPIARERLGKNARERVVNKYTWRQHVRSILNFIQR